MCQACGGTCGTARKAAPKRFTIDVNMGGRRQRFVLAGGRLVADKGAWSEEQHPRANNGQFGTKSGGSSAKAEPKPEPKPEAKGKPEAKAETAPVKRGGFTAEQHKQIEAKRGERAHHIASTLATKGKHQGENRQGQPVVFSKHPDGDGKYVAETLEGKEVVGRKEFSSAHEAAKHAAGLETKQSLHNRVTTAAKKVEGYKPGLHASSPIEAGAKKAAWAETAPKTIEDLFAHSPHNQDELAKVAEVAGASVATPFKNPGIKGMARTLEKVQQGKAPNKINDIVRGGFDVHSPEHGDAIIRKLAEKFEVADEGWAKNDQGYFDRKAMVRFPSGQVGEIQMWAPGMLEAKSNGGHKLYEQWRSMDPETQPAKHLEQQMKNLYAEVEKKLPASWKGLFTK